MRILLLSWIFLIPLFQILLGIDIVLVSGQCLDNQRLLLLQLKNSLKFNETISTRLVNWNQTKNCSLWGGVTWDTGGRVIGLDLFNESISGGIDNSSALFSLQFLQSLNLSYNIFNSSQIPSGFSNLTRLRHLNLSNAAFAGQIPIDFSSMTRLVTLDLSTLFAGIPPLNLENPDLKTLVQNLTELTELRLDNVNISAQGHEWWQALSSSLPNLRVLSLSHCHLSGPIDSSLAKHQSLSEICLSQNNLSAAVPKFLANFTNLTVLRLSSCNLQDTFPEEIFKVLVLRSNRFSGPIGCSRNKSNWPMLQIIDLASNKFRGSLQPQCFSTWKAMTKNEVQGPSELNHLHFEIVHGLYYQDTVTVTSKGLEMKLVKILTVFTSIDFSNNSFEGAIPAKIGDLKALRVLNLSRNAFNSTIPPSIGDLKQLESLDLSQNNLSGRIPVQLVNVNFLSFFNVSHNQLTGSIPKGRQFDTFTAASYEGNRGLCGPPLSTSCGNTTMLPPPPSSSSSNDSVTIVETEFDWQFIFIGLGFGIGAGIIVGPLMFWKQGRNWCNDNIDKLLLMILPTYFIHISCGNLKVEAEESIDDEATDDTEKEGEDETEDEAFRGRYCVFCTKLEMCRKKAIHNPKCTCHDTPPIASSSSASSSSSLES